MFLVPEKYDETVSNPLQVYMYQYKMWNSKEYPFPSHQRSLEILMGWGPQKPKERN